MPLVVIDLIPALLSWEGRDLSGEPEIPPDAFHALDHLYGRFRLAGIADAAGATGATLRSHLDREDLAALFESIGTSAAFGPEVSPRVIRRLVRTLGGPDDRALVVTARPHLVEPLNTARIPVVLTTPAEFGAVPEAVELLLGKRISP